MKFTCSLCDLEFENKIDLQEHWDLMAKKYHTDFQKVIE